MKKNEKIGDTIPLYDDVKRTIYINFNEMSYAYSDLMTSSNSSSYKLALWDFKKRFIKFFIQINHKNKLDKLQPKQREYLKEAYKGIDNINKNSATNIINISREMLERLGITKIEGRVHDDWAI